MALIREEYKKIYGNNLTDVIKSELSGDFEKLCVAIVAK